MDNTGSPQPTCRWGWGPNDQFGGSLKITTPSDREIAMTRIFDGGAFRYVWRGPDGIDLGMRGVHRDYDRLAELLASTKEAVQ